MMLLALFHCGANDKKENSSEDFNAILLSFAMATDENLPEPAINTVNIIVGETKYTKSLGVCRGNLNVNGQDDISIAPSDLSLPSFYLHKVDFTTKTNVTLTAIGSSFNLNIDMPNGGGYDPATTCEAKIIENSATTYDIQAKKCSVDKIAVAVDPPTNTISFRARCTKGL